MFFFDCVGLFGNYNFFFLRLLCQNQCQGFCGEQSFVLELYILKGYRLVMAGVEMMVLYFEISLGFYLNFVIWIFNYRENYRYLEFIKVYGFIFYVYVFIYLYGERI